MRNILCRNLPVFLSYSVFVGILCLASCDKPVQRRSYTEIVVKPSENAFMAPRHDVLLPMTQAPDSVSWTTPAQWQEVKGSGMRLVSFKALDDQSIDVSIISLGGAAGGLKANLTRWLGQLNITVADHDLEQLMASPDHLTTEQGSEVDVYHFNSFVQSPDGSSMSVGILNNNGQTIFIKMTGTVKGVSSHRDAFLSLCRSITF